MKCPICDKEIYSSDSREVDFDKLLEHIDKKHGLGEIFTRDKLKKLFP